MIFKAKKYIASKLSESSSGQSLILRLFGVRGVAVMNGLYNSAARFYGEKTAKQLKLDILKLILKIVLLYRNKVITPEMAAPARPKMLSMMDMIVDTLEMPSPDSRNVAELSASFQATHDAAMPLLQPNVREHNWMRLTRIFDSYGSKEFLSMFLCDAAYETDREDILANFKSLVQPYSEEMSSMKEFLRKQSEQRRARIEKMTTAPYSLRAWLEDVQGSVLFQDWLREKSSAESLHLLLFLRAVDYYRGTNNRSLLSQRAGQVVDTFLSSTAKQPIQLDDGVRTKVLSLAEEGKGSRAIFDDAEADATTQLTEIFLKFFPDSEQFKSLVAEIQSIDTRMKRMDKLDSISAENVEEITGGLDQLELNEDEDDEATVATENTEDSPPSSTPPAGAAEEPSA
jgi:hypothetical protein